MSPLEEFVAKVEEYTNNSVTAFIGEVQVTSNEREDLKQMFAGLEKADQVKAIAFLEGKKVTI